MKATKGFKWGRKNKKSVAKEALLHAYSHAFRGRTEQKRNFRRLWNVLINAGARQTHATNGELSNIHRSNQIELDSK